MRIAILGLAAALVACSGGGDGKLSLSTKVALSGAATSGGGANASVAIGDHVTLERARFLIRKVALEAEPTDGSAQEGEGGGSDDSLGETVVRWGPLVIDLSGAQLDGAVKLEFDEAVPAGTYEELTFQLHKLTPGESVTDPDFTELGSSIILDLTVDEQSFTFESDLTAVAEIEGPFTVPEGGSINVTVTVDPSGWFSASDGSFLDPRVDANRSRIEQNIRQSIRGFEDDDHDGQPDHG